MKGSNVAERRGPGVISLPLCANVWVEDTVDRNVRFRLSSNDHSVPNQGIREWEKKQKRPDEKQMPCRRRRKAY